MLEIASAALISCTLLAEFGQLGVVFELASHFAFQYALGLGVILVLLLVRKQYIPAAFSLAALLFNVWLMSWAFLPSEGSSVASSSDISIMQYNVNSKNKNRQELLTFLKKEDVDIICIEELSPVLDDYLKENLPASYTCRLTVPRNDNFGIGLYSKIKIEDLKPVSYTKAGIPSIEGVFNMDNEAVKLICTHTLPPISNATARNRNQHLETIINRSKSTPGSLLLAGDLNTTPYSFYFKKLLADSGLKDTGRGFGLHPTWPRIIPIFDLPIDHVLLKGNLSTVSRQVKEGIGSDHRAVIVTFTIKKPS